MAESLTFPQAKNEYFWTGGQNLVDDGYKWAFGLCPNDDIHLSTGTCGAMPFRSEADRGLSAKCCIRGEDIVFFHNWALDRSVETGSIWNWPIPRYPSETKQPSLYELSCVRNFQEKMRSCWFKDFSLTDHVINNAVQSTVRSELSACFTQADAFTQTPDWQDDRFLKQRVMNLFDDSAKLKCTASNGWADTTEGNTLWYWYQRDGEPSYQETSNISQLVLNYNPMWHDYDRPLEFDVQFIGVFSSYQQQYYPGSGQTIYDNKYVMANILDKMAITQRNAEHEFYRLTTWGGTRAATAIAAAAGHSIRPAVPTDGWSSYTCSLVEVIPVIWPKYLQLP